jgi:hypothetical protein
MQRADQESPFRDRPGNDPPLSGVDESAAQDPSAAPVEVVRRAGDAIRALEALSRAALAECGRGDPDSSASFSLHWVAGSTPDELAEQAFRQAAELASDDLSFCPGHVYCYACRSPDCNHSTPPACGAVFAGYESTGRPRWQEFFNYLLELEDSRTDLLFAEPPRMLARLVGRRRLVSAQLASFGKNSLTYRIWGQVVAGYIHIHGVRSAMSVQVVEDRKRTLRLQVIADTETRDVLANAPDSQRSAFHRVYDALVESRRRISSLNSRWQHAKNRETQREIRDRAFGVLRHLVHSVERKGRQHRRRTAHAELRGAQNRPVHKAYDDLSAASPESFFNDTVRHSIIVLGKSSRAHVFNPAGKLITSFLLAGDELERRVHRKRYAPYAAADMKEFRNRALVLISPASQE